MKSRDELLQCTNEELMEYIALLEEAIDNYQEEISFYTDAFVEGLI